jgi:hypothetical protein
MLDESQLRELLPGVQLTLVNATAEAQQSLGSIGKEQEIYRPLIWVLFAIIAVEFLLATVRGSRKEGESEITVADRIRQISAGSWVSRMTGSARK